MRKVPKHAKVQEGKGSTDEKLKLLEDDDDKTDDTLRVSEKFAKRYNEKKDKEELTRARRILADEDAGGSSYSDTESEDEAADLLTGQVEDKIFETLNRIKCKDPSIYDQSAVFFNDDDFVGKTGRSSSSKGKSLHYKDFLRETLMREGSDAIAREEELLEDEGAGRKHKFVKSEEEDVRKDILCAVQGEGGDDDGGELFTLKEKSATELQEEARASSEFDSKRKALRQRLADGGELGKYWADDDSELDENERFLRDYIMNRSWQETASLQPKGEENGGDGSEEEHLEKVDDFEKEYNFRFEMEDGASIQGHKRFQESSVRQKSDKRKRQRKEKTERKEIEKIRRVEELKRLKNLKKQEIMRRLQQIAEVTGNEEVPLGKVNLDTDFDPEAHDRDMAAMFSEDYENATETLDEDELKRVPMGLKDLDTTADAEGIAERRGPARRAGEREAEGEEDAEGDDVEEADPEEWWLCDECQCGIPGGKKRFDCTECENYTLCQKCFRIRRHPHKFIRRRVPDGCSPPEDLKGSEANREDMSKVLDEYFQLDYEDIIGGDLPTRFKYQKVTPNDCGMSMDQILSKSDQELNRIVPLKKLRTYRTDNAKVRSEARWRARKGRLAEGGPEQRKGAGKGGGARPHKASADGSLGTRRLSAYNLQADRRQKQKGENVRKDKRKKTKPRQ